MPQKPGEVLQRLRQARSESLNGVARAAEISAAYLQKLERSEVKQPSPHVLLRLSKALRVSYDELMRLYGYLKAGRRNEASGTSLLAQALSSENLTEDELKALARYLEWYRHNNGQGV